MKATKILKIISGVQAYEDRKEAKLTVEQAKHEYAKAAKETKRRIAVLNKEIDNFGRVRLECLNKTTRQFILCLNDLRQKSKTREFEYWEAIDIKKEHIAELKNLEMSTSQILTGTVAASALGAAALTGVPVMVTGTVAAVASASTGAAISTLSGAAATNAVLAVLGGGTLAAGGGGVAAGAAVLSAITYSATGGVAILAAGLIASAHYSKKLTEAKKHEKEAKIAIAKMEESWIIMDGIQKRINELKELTESLTCRAMHEMKYLMPLIPDFQVDDLYHLEVFQKCGLLVLAGCDLARAPIFDDQGDISEETGIIANKIRMQLAQ